MIDLTQIPGFENGQRSSFEDLIKVLARRVRPDNALTFQPYDGRGGDGGVEAIWILDNGDKIGYQSKFFKTLGEPQWKQMTESVTQALKTHPELKKYVFALPIDFTPNRGPKVKGKSQQEKWDDHIETWKALAEKSSITLDFEYWGATAINHMLLLNENSGLREFWFGRNVLDDPWFKKQVLNSILKLDDRFNPEDHVEVSIESMFDTVVRGPNLRHQLKDAFNLVANKRLPTITFTSASLTPNPETIDEAQKCWNDLVALRDLVDRERSVPWDWSKAKPILKHLQSLISKLRQPYLSIEREHLEKPDVTNLEILTTSFKELQTALRELDSALEQRGLLAEAARYILVLGEAGSGKSHSLGRAASQRAQLGLPTILVLGQDLADAPFWPQLGGLLGIKAHTADEILSVLNAAGERKKERTLLIFDAINEGAGAAYWMHWFPQILEALNEYPYIAAVFSCRDVYSEYAIPKNLIGRIPTIRIQGFSSADEKERAAIQYLDKKGISRPNTPWLSPEFTNPLFLKSASEAIKAQGKTEFPRGLQGVSELMSLYLEGLASRTGIPSLRSDDLSASLKQYVQRIADTMASNGKDYVELSIASDLAQEYFGNRQPPIGRTWFDVFIQVNLLRRDPPPYSEENGPLKPTADLIRFSFQRFQDYLMADALVESVLASKKSRGLLWSIIQQWGKKLIDRLRIERGGAAQGREFRRGGPLNFIFHERHQSQEIQYKYTGLIAALSTIYPEKLKVEFATQLPNWRRHWEEGTVLQHGFSESFKWRRVDAFTDETRSLLDALNEAYLDPLELLLDVSITADHPFNAEFLHSYLQDFSLAERDSYWTQWINGAYNEDHNQLERIVSWALTSGDRETNTKHMELASLVLGWCCASTNMTLRDRATKALTKLFLANSGVFIFLFELMHSCDDPYVMERVHAAAFGSCCIDQDADRLSTYSETVFAKIFANGTPPIALLTRDYAFGIIELAAFKSALVSGVRLEDCAPPYNSEEPVFDLTKERVEELADSCGGRSIFQSASSEWGDFGKYTVPGRVDSFLTTRLNEPYPISRAELREQCEKDVIAPYPERVAAFESYKKASKSTLLHILSQKMRLFESEENLDHREPDSVAESEENAKAEALAKLLELLSPLEQTRFSEECINSSAALGEYKKVSIDQCRLWITKRAYELGWEHTLFPMDGHRSSYSRQESNIERIGKKYQRIALDELQARLADNFWMLGEWPERPMRYLHSHTHYRRNIEPTISPEVSRDASKPLHREDWLSEPRIVLPEVAEEKLKEWPFSEDVTSSISEKLVRIDEQNKRWIVLYEFNLAAAFYDPPKPGGHGKRYEEFRFLYSVFVRKGQATEFIEFLKATKGLDVSDFKPSEFTDGPFLGEAVWRDTWKAEKFGGYISSLPPGCEFAIPVANYQWESSLDRTLPDGFSAFIPQKWFAEELGLAASRHGPQYWCDADGNTVFQSSQPVGHQTTAVISGDLLQRYSQDYEVEPVWILIAERNTWPNGDNAEACWRRSEGAAWLESGNWKQVGWHNDYGI
ncbi:MAG: hypothetical protein ING71_15995 [Rhodocyclaceae bacterium]|nr:hypothetical protein [Rhodocyclaceae bacterium]